MTEAVLIGVIVLLIALVVLVTLQFSRALRAVLLHADSIHSRSQKHLDSVLDRLMSMDFATFKAWETAQNQTEPGGFTPPPPTRFHEDRPYLPQSPSEEETQIK